MTIVHETRLRKIRDEPKGREGVLESGICSMETRIKNERTPLLLGISDSIGMCRECPPGDVLTPCHSVGFRVPKYPFGTFLHPREFPVRRFEDGCLLIVRSAEAQGPRPLNRVQLLNFQSKDAISSHVIF